MSIIFLTNMFCEKSLNEALKYAKPDVQIAPHNFSMNFISGFEKNNVSNFYVIHIPPIGSFPIHYKKIYSNGYEYDKNIQIGYLNLPILKKNIQIIKLKSKLEKIINLSYDSCIIIVYSLDEVFLKTCKYIKKKYPHILIILIQPDAVPGFEDIKQHMTIKNKLLGKKLVSLSSICDGFILFTKYLKTPLRINDKPYMIMECICNENQKMNKVSNSKNRSCLYSGALMFEYGIKNLVEAFKYLPDVEIIICGTGEAESYIKEMEKKYPNIKYKGFLDQKTLSLMRDKADYLINPRTPSGSYTKYSFPSKTAEYMMSGKPVIMYKIEGIPDEYDVYLNYLYGKTPMEIKKELEILFEKDYFVLLEKSKKAREFMIKRKSATYQIKRVLKFIEEVKSHEN